MRLSRTTRQAYLVMVCSVVVAMVLQEAGVIVNRCGILPGYAMGTHVGTYTCYACFTLVWMRLARTRFLNRAVRGCVQAASLVMLTWLLVRTVKFEIAQGNCTAGRCLWYCYYLGFTFIPALLLLAVLHLGLREDERIDRRWWLLLVGAGVLSALVLANDVHQLAFRFPPEMPLSQVDDTVSYVHGPLYYLCMLWMCLSALASVVISLVRCGRMLRKRALALPLGLLAVAAFYMLASMFSATFRLWSPMKTTEFTCVMTVVFIEALVGLGLFPANDHYGELWRASSLAGGLVDADGGLVAASASVPAVTASQLADARVRRVPLDSHHVLAARDVRGGTAFWVRDLSRIHALQARVAELGDVLAEENAALSAENSLAHERALVAQRQRLYEQIAAYSGDELAALDAQLGALPHDEAAFLQVMHRMAVRATYIKRSANLILLGEEGAVPVHEVRLALDELATWLQSCGVAVRVAPIAAGTLPTDDALSALKGFYEAAAEAPAGSCVACRFDGPSLVVHVLTDGGGAA